MLDKRWQLFESSKELHNILKKNLVKAVAFSHFSASYVIAPPYSKWMAFPRHIGTFSNSDDRSGQTQPRHSAPLVKQAWAS